MRQVLLTVAVAAAGVTTVALLKRGEGAKASTVTATVEARETEISSQIGGRVVELHVEEGRHVKRGDVLAVIDDEEIRLKIARMEARIDIARAERVDLKAHPRNAELALQRSKIEEARAFEDKARTQAERARRLAVSSAGTKAELEDAQLTLSSAAERVQTEKSALELLRAAPRRSILDAQDARIIELQRELELLNLELKRTRVEAPVDGVVLRRNFELGETVQAGAALVTLLDPADLWVELAADERMHGQIKLGQAAEIRAEVRPDQPVAGSVSFVADRHSFTPRDVQTKDERGQLTFRVKLAMKSPPDWIKPGMFVEVSFR
jgi:HlyD family secretion protein